MNVPTTIGTALAALCLAIPAIYIHRSATAPARRALKLSPTEERVLIIGASSGVGRAIAELYAARGAKVCIVARRAEEISALAKECGGNCIWQAADFSKPDDMVLLRERLLEEWQGLDTLHICAGVSAVQPLMALTGVRPAEEDASGSDIQRAVDIAGRAVQGNFDGPLVSALTFIPLLRRTSTCPALLLVSSVAALIPAPTRSLYAATKASSLLLFQSLAIEHPQIAFSFMLPATIEGNFRASAVDVGPEQRAEPNKRGLRVGLVAWRCVDAVDCGTTGNIVLPWFPYALAHLVYLSWPSFIEKQARKKYNFEA